MSRLASFLTSHGDGQPVPAQEIDANHDTHDDQPVPDQVPESPVPITILGEPAGAVTLPIAQEMDQEADQEMDKEIETIIIADDNCSSTVIELSQKTAATLLDPEDSQDRLGNRMYSIATPMYNQSMEMDSGLFSTSSSSNEIPRNQLHPSFVEALNPGYRYTTNRSFTTDLIWVHPLADVFRGCTEIVSVPCLRPTMFKIGITADPYFRWQEYFADGYLAMIIIYECDDPAPVESMERDLIHRLSEWCDTGEIDRPRIQNINPGGEGLMHRSHVTCASGPPFYTYLVVGNGAHIGHMRLARRSVI